MFSLKTSSGALECEVKDYHLVHEWTKKGLMRKTFFSKLALFGPILGPLWHFLALAPIHLGLSKLLAASILRRY